METSTKYVLAGAAVLAVGYYAFFRGPAVNPNPVPLGPPQPPAPPVPTINPVPPPAPAPPFRGNPLREPVPLASPSGLPFSPSTPEVQAALNALQAAQSMF